MATPSKKKKKKIYIYIYIYFFLFIYIFIYIYMPTSRTTGRFLHRNGFNNGTRPRETTSCVLHSCATFAVSP